MTTIVAGRFTTFDAAEGSARKLHERAFGQDDVSIFFLNPAGQHARFPLGGDGYADSAAQPGGRGAMAGAVHGMLLGFGVGLIAYAAGWRFWYTPLALALAACISACWRARSRACEGGGTKARARWRRAKPA